MRHISEQRAPRVVRTSEVGLLVKEPATAGIDYEILFGERGAPPTEAASFGRPVGHERIGIGLNRTASI